MTAAAQLLEELAKHGVRVRVEGDRLALSPAGALTPELRARVVAAKPALIELLEPQPLDPAVARREVLCYPALLLPELPLPTTLGLELVGGEAFTVATHPACATRATWCASEWLALVLGAEHERVYPQTLGAWLARKRADPSWMLTQVEAIALPVTSPSRGWSLERVLRQLGAVLRDVHIDGGES